jgi:hypothetical protein
LFKRSSDIADLLLTFQCNLQGLPDTVQPDGNRALILAKHLSQFSVSHAFDVAQQKQACVVFVQRGERTAQLLF